MSEIAAKKLRQGEPQCSGYLSKVPRCSGGGFGGDFLSIQDKPIRPMWVLTPRDLFSGIFQGPFSTGVWGQGEKETSGETS